MGFGDDLMVTAMASRIKKNFPDRQIVIGNVSKKQANHSFIYDNNPNIADCRKLNKNKTIHIINYHQGNRPYIDYEKSKKYKKYIWNKNFRPEPGQIFFSEKEKDLAKNILKKSIEFWKKTNKKNFKAIIFLETSSTKIDDSQFAIKHKNKDWGINNWRELIKRIKNDFLIIHSSHENTKNIKNLYDTGIINFREACAVLNICDLYLGPEGGFGHAAAALNKNAVIYFGGWISPKIIGYPFHENIYFQNSNSPCGEYKQICKHCEEARKKITVEYFEERIRSYFMKSTLKNF